MAAVTDVADEATTSPGDLASPGEPQNAVLNAPINVRSVSLAVLALLGILFALNWARDVVIPVLLGLMLSYALNPPVTALQRLRIPRPLGAAVTIVTLVGSLCWTAYALRSDAGDLIESLPEAAQKVRQALRAWTDHSESAIDKVQKAASQLEKAAQESGPQMPAATGGVTRVRIERAPFDLGGYLWSSTLVAAASIGQTVAVLFIAFFLLASGNSFRRKMTRLAGPTFAKRRITVEVLDEITGQIQRYLLVQAFTSSFVGIAVGLIFHAIGMEHAAVWGVIAAVLNLVPYLGAVALTGASTLLAFMQFGNLHMALAAGAVSISVNTIEGGLLTPWLTSRTSRMNAVSVFVGLLAFGWLWGLWGLLLGVPVLAAVKTVCDRVDDLKPIGELLGV
jgi:predicted PurR-regulated permease PerM